MAILKPMIKSFKEALALNPKFKFEIKNIFFLSSTRDNFKNQNEKDNFFNKWTQYYFEYCQDSSFVYIKDNKILAYITCDPKEIQANSHQEVWVHS